MRRQLRGMLWPLFLLAVLAYFGELAWQGRAGLIEQRELAAQEARLAAELAALKAERARLEARIAAIRGPDPDPDLLDEVARRNLGYMRSDELVIPSPAPAGPGVPAR